MKQALFLLFLLFTTSFNTFSQTTNDVKPTVEEPSEDRVYDFAEVNPEYPTGINGLRKEVGMNYIIPKDYNGVGGTIVVRFVVDTDGSVQNITILKGLADCDSCNEMAIESLRSLEHKFNPGLQDGEAVRVHYTIPIVLKNKPKKKKKKPIN